MSERWVIKWRNSYWTGTQWGVREEALVYNQRPSDHYFTAAGFDGCKRVRLRTKSERLEEKWKAEEAERAKLASASEAARRAERARIAKWLETWLNFNKLARPDVYTKRERRLTEGLVAALEEICPRLRADDLLPSWKWPP